MGQRSFKEQTTSWLRDLAARIPGRALAGGLGRIRLPFLARVWDGMPVLGRSDRDLADAENHPLRSELLSLQQLAPYARDLAGRHQAAVGRGPDMLLPRLAENERGLRRSHAVVADTLAQGRRIEPAAEWLLDNFYLVEQQIQQTRLYLPRTYSRRLPRLTAGVMAGFPRVYHMAIDLIAHLDGRLDAETVTCFVQAYQEVTPLRLSELWAFPIALRLGLIENLRHVASRVAARRRERDDGIAWAERMIATATEHPKQLIHLLAAFADRDRTLTAPFLEEFNGRLRGYGNTFAFVLNWVEQALVDEHVTAAQRLEADSHAQAAEQLSIANSIGSLRFLGAMDWKEFVETLSVVDRTLRGDPSGAYTAQDFATRDRYRHVVETLAERCDQEEVEVARAAIGLAERAAVETGVEGRQAHVGYFLVDAGRAVLRRALGCRGAWADRLLRGCERGALGLYLGAILAVTAAITATAYPGFAGYGLAALRFWLFAVTAVLAATSLAVSMVNFLVALVVPPRALSRLDFSEGIPSDHRTMVAIPCLLSDTDTLNGLLEGLEIRYLGNRDPNLFFALLTDFPDAETETMPGDEALLQRVKAGIDALNARYPRKDERAVFHLFHRPRRWNPHERLWMGYERKRGKLEQFNALLRGAAPDAFSVIIGDTGALRSVKYVITLDADTDLPRGVGHRLAAAMAHPLNRPRFDAARGRVVEGYAILQPRPSIRMAAARSGFARLFGGETGLDPYTREVSDIYQDLFGEGSYVGKGIYDVDAFRQALEGRFPENRILSHDLLESGYARSALLSGVEVHEDFPVSYLGEISRRHRWIRGDWQIARWLFPRPPTGSAPRGPNPLSALTRYKIFDNLRRSLVAPALLVWLVGGWLLAPAAPLAFLLFAAAILFFSGLLRSLTQLLRKPHERGWHPHLRATARAAGICLAEPLLALLCLPYDAWVTANAIGRCALRPTSSRRGLLLWRLPQDRRRDARRTLAGFYIEMGPAVGVVLAVMLLGVAGFGAAANGLAAGAPFLAAWLLAPLVCWWLSRPTPQLAPGVNAAQVRQVRTLARQTWRFFETFVGEESHWLPPDNFQETPNPEIAARTSPTNMGLTLLANLSAWDFGYISTGRLLERCRRTLDAMARLERYRGHFYNWYDIQALRTLRPMYVSSVDSGNLAGCLVALRGGLEELRAHPVLPPRFRDGLDDTLAAMCAAVGARPPPELLRIVATANATAATPLATPAAARACFDALRTIAAELKAAVQPLGDNAQAWARAFAQQCEDHAADLNALLPDALARAHDPMPTLEALAAPQSPPPAEGTPDSGRQALERLREIERLAAQCQEFEAAMDFRFLYDSSRRLLSIGYDVDARRRDPGCYDLLASEARLASFLLVAGEQAPMEHWFALGRLLTGEDGAATLISWSGSMFEYLMPALVMPHYRNTLLDRTCRAVIARQIRYGRQRGIPWGISESCYNARDARHVYQYRAFGVPGLGLQRGLASDLVVAPYATMLALPFAPREACENLERLAAREDALGAYGLYEAVDYSPARVPRGKSRAVVRAFMTHHQGMGLIAMANLIHDGPMIRRFMADPAMRATDLLLQERMPQTAPVLRPHEHEVKSAALPATVDPVDTMRIFADPDSPTPEVHSLSNGNYHVMVTHAGGSASRWRDLAVTRWREDVTRDHWGTFLYLRDVATAAVWSAAFQPVGQPAKRYEAIFTQGRAEYRRRDGDIETHTEICVSPEDDVEIRRVTLSNGGRGPRRVELTSYAEVALAPANADLAHPAFSKLFVRTEILADRQAILCSRRKRSHEDADPWMFHLLVAPDGAAAPTFETDRARFLGRGRTTARPAALDTPAGQPAPLANGAGFVLDPIIAARQLIELPTDRTTWAHVITGIAETREAALALIDKYNDRHFVDRAFDMAWSHSQIVMRQLNVTEAEAQIYGRLAGSMLFAHARHRAPAGVIAANRMGQRGLWRFGISGDLPIILLRISDLNRMDRVHDALRAHAYWRMKGLASDLVIVNEDYSGYRATLNDQIMGAVTSGPDAGFLDRPGGVFVRRIETLTEDDQVLLQTVARVVLSDSAETLQEQVDRRVAPRRLPADFRPAEDQVREPRPVPLAPRERIFENGLGGFTPDGREYVIMLEPGRTTPAPWANVIASPRIGTVVSESGGMYTWVGNAHEFRITPWENDPVTDACGEAFYLRDEDTGRFWSLTPLPAPGAAGSVCRHGFGYTVFEHDESDVFTEAWVYVAMDAPVKFVTVKVSNHSGRPRRLSLTAFFELVMGEWRHGNAMHIVTERDPQTGGVFARNPYGRDFAQHVVFAGCSEARKSVTGSRAEFLGRNGHYANPAALRRARLSNATGAGFDPGAGLQAVIELADGQSREVVFTLGAADNAEAARACLARFGGPVGARAALEAVWAHWNHTLDAVHVETPDAATNVLVNGWLPYQALSCRMWGRSGYYQSGGAYGFRDQLQDAMALIHAVPGVLREQVLRCAARQFVEGDVQHWWHPPGGAGVRTHFSDDYLWLPQAVARYVHATGDSGVLDEMVPFLTGRAVNPDEEAYYEEHAHASESGTLYEHCVRALRRGLRFGVHGLPLIGCGDWNDGMNLIGREGRGESVWLAWFLRDALVRFAAVADMRNDAGFADFCREQGEAVRARTEAAAWDGGWYRRAYFDDGTPLGSAQNDECRIDSLGQSWAVIGGGGQPARARLAMDAVVEQLVRPDDGLIRLFTPPFDRSAMEPGYIKGYPPGMRENGGQYTHGAVWSVMALALLGDHDRAWDLFRMLNPILHGDTAEKMKRYRVEPYVMAADIYGVAPHVGRGGWTWYTGAAGWMYRLAVETLLGLEWHNDHLTLTPRLPASGWELYRLRYRYRETTYHIEVRKSDPPSGGMSTRVDGIDQPDHRIPLTDDRRDHHVEVIR